MTLYDEATALEKFWQSYFFGYIVILVEIVSPRIFLGQKFGHFERVGLIEDI